MKKRIQVEYEFYDVHQTDEYKKEIKKVYKYIAKAKEFGFKKYPDGTEDKWLNKVDSFVEGLNVPRNLGIIDPEHFSDTYSHVQIPDTETTAFLLVEGNQIYLATSGWSRLPWHEISKGKEIKIDKQIQELKNSRIELEQKTEKTAPKGKIILPASKGGKGSGNKTPPAPEKSKKPDKDDHEK